MWGVFAADTLRLQPEENARPDIVGDFLQQPLVQPIQVVVGDAAVLQFSKTRNPLPKCFTPTVLVLFVAMVKEATKFPPHFLVFIKQRETYVALP